MPIYAYQCQDCGHELEALQKISDVPLTECPSCGQPRLKKQLTAPAFRLSGSGWYETDFKKDNRKNLAGDSGGEGKSSGESKTAPSESAGQKKKADGAGATTTAS